MRGARLTSLLVLVLELARDVAEDCGRPEPKPRSLSTRARSAASPTADGRVVELDGDKDGEGEGEYAGVDADVDAGDDKPAFGLSEGRSGRAAVVTRVADELAEGDVEARVGARR